jgi:hypothetical protein
MARHHATPQGNIPFTAQEESDRDAEEVVWANAKPMENWKSSMQGTDSQMPRPMEDLITSNDSLVIPAVMRERYDEKVALRATKP